MSDENGINEEVATNEKSVLSEKIGVDEEGVAGEDIASEESATNEEGVMIEENGMGEEIATSEENAIGEKSTALVLYIPPPKAPNRLMFLLFLLPFRVLRWLTRRIFGESFKWSPRWAAPAGRGVAAAAGYARRYPVQIAGGVLALAAMAAGWAWWEAQPRPPEPPEPAKVVLTVKNPECTNYGFDEPIVSPLKISFSEEVAALDSVGKEVASENITISPPLAGKWRWESATVLVFLPETDWPIDSWHTVKFSPEMFRPEARIDSYKTGFQTARFGARLLRAHFEQNPTDQEDMKVSASINFTHPVDTADFVKRVSMALEGQEKGFFGQGGEKKTGFEVSFDEKKLYAYIHSEKLPVPDKGQTIRVTVDKGVRAAIGGNKTTEALTATAYIPALDGLKVSNIELAGVINDRYQPEQVLMLELSMPVSKQKAKDIVKVWLLPKQPPEGDTRREGLEADEIYPWSITSVDSDLLKVGKPLKPEALPDSSGDEVVHAFNYRYQAPPGRYIYVHVPKGLKAFGGHHLAEDAEYVFQVPVFPPVAQIMAQGSLLSLSGERKLSVMARDVPAIRYSISRVVPQQLQYLVNKSLRYSSDFSNPSLDNYHGSVNELDIAERFEKVVELPVLEPGKPQYQALDLTEYLGQAGKKRRGVFLLRVQGFDPKTKQVVEDQDDQPVQDSRLVMVSDLGLIEKKNVDGSHDLFVQSIHRGG
ncbi:MAG: hypothetical protein FWH56_12840, partial [Betaproteobacteria bacterium]|nr:hypothetical protein [Betaproteobacteria bacterium]